MGDLAASARRWGVELGYHDVFGKWHDVPEATLRAIIAALSKARPKPTVVGNVEQDLRAFQGDGSKLWGLAVQLYSVRSQRNWGVGDFSDLREIVAIAAASGASAVGLNPLHALFLDRPELASPYGPNSRLFLNPIYIAVDAVPEYRRDVSAETIAARLSEGSLVDYTSVAALKLATLRDCYVRFVKEANAARRADFDAYRVEQGGALTRFSCFEVLRTRYGEKPWWEWPQLWRTPNAAALAQLRDAEQEACGFAEYLQWLADRQLARCRADAAEKGMSIGLYLDLAIGVDPAGADAWSTQDAIVADVSVGAPADEFNPAGQNWGLAPFNPHALPDKDLGVMRQLLSASMRHAGAVRLDHVLGLMRLYFIPKGMSAKEGSYVRFPFEQLLRVVAEESAKHRCIFIGEDLGTVPEGFRETAARWGVWTYRVMMFERWQNGEFKPPADYPAEALAAFNTHDLPTFCGWMCAGDLAIKRGIGVDPGESDETRRNAQSALRQILAPFAGPNPPDSFPAAAGFLAATPCRLVMVAVEDMLNVMQQVNIPGTVEQYPNWRQKLPVSLEEWRAEPTFQAVCAAFDYSGRGRRKT